MIPWMPTCHQLTSSPEVETQTNYEVDTFNHLQISFIAKLFTDSKPEHWLEIISLFKSQNQAAFDL